MSTLSGFTINRFVHASKRGRLFDLLILILLLTPYLLYLGYIIRTNQGPVDYETFMQIGQNYLNGEAIYGENSYYPLPYVMIFAFFSWLPRPISMTIWFLLPVIITLAIAGWSPYILLFAPVFGHFVGGQTAIFGLIGLWGFRRNVNPDIAKGGIWLGITLLKPQLGLIPLMYALFQWWRYFRTQNRVPIQFWAWCITMAIIFLPGFIIMPDWLSQWLNNPRPLSERAMAGFLPRMLNVVLDNNSFQFWLILVGLSIVLLIGIKKLNKQHKNFDLLVIWSFVVSPLIHDYDLIQIVPLLDKQKYLWLAILISIPGWIVIISAYDNDQAWWVFTLIAPFLMGVLLYTNHFNSGRQKI